MAWKVEERKHHIALQYGEKAGFNAADIVEREEGQ